MISISVTEAHFISLLMAYSKIIQFFTKPRINLATMASFDKRAQSLRRRFEQDNRPLPKLTLGAINRDGSFHYTQAFGDEVGKPDGTDSVYWLASATKLITTIAVMQCV